MNSESRESAAWRSFGMLDADKAAAFDEALRQNPELRDASQEMDRLAAAVAVTAAVPIAPRAGQLERLHRRLGLHPAKRTNWLGITGWAAAAVLTLILVLDRTGDRKPRTVGQPPIHPANLEIPSEVTPPEPEVPTEEERILTRAPEVIAKTELPVTRPDGDAVVIAKVETKRLIQEIEVLREQLESALERDRERFESVPGMAWPIVVRMKPPATFSENPAALAAMVEEDPPITSILGDALAAANPFQPPTDPFNERTIPPPPAPVAEIVPSATPIYDSARDAGTLVVSNLPATTADEAYNLWVTTRKGNKPVHVGRLPESNVRGGESFDFSLGSKATVPSSFILTKDRLGEPAPPSGNNTVLVGPR